MSWKREDEPMVTILETERLRIRRFELEDDQTVFAQHRAPEVKMWFPNEWYRDLDEARGAVEFYRTKVDAEELPYVLAVEWKENGRLIGDIGFRAVENTAGSLEIEVGYSIFTDYAGQGFATEAVNAACEYMHEKFSVQRVYGRILRGNRRSVRVMEKCGFEFAREEFGTADDFYGDGVLVFCKIWEENGR